VAIVGRCRFQNDHLELNSLAGFNEEL
jgi:hypothetical protein